MGWGLEFAHILAFGRALATFIANRIGISTNVGGRQVCDVRRIPLLLGTSVNKALNLLCSSRERFFEPVEGALVKERASSGFAVVARPFGVREPDQLLRTSESLFGKGEG
jgi:hypothetical protein